MVLLLTFIAVWTLSPGPVFIMTLQQTRRHGAPTGVAIAGGAAITSTLMVLFALAIHATGFTAILESDGMMLVERVGAAVIIWLGFHAGWRTLRHQESQAASATVRPGNRTGLLQGASLMATYIPQALLFYNVIVPQTVGLDSLVPTIIALGTLKISLIFGWHAGAALLAARLHNLVNNRHFSKVLELVAAGLIMAIGVNIFL
ncbi:MAG: LysE family transporter [Anaerolineales bacterium]|nr:LysE family transporter [Anaerolineales bacterium]